MRGNAVARNYAEVLLELASRDGSRETIEQYDGLTDDLRALFQETPALRTFLANPRVEIAKKQDLVRTVFGDRVPTPFLRFLLVVVGKGRGPALPLITEEFRALVDERLGRVRVEVRVARPADEATRTRIEAALERRFEQTVMAEYVVDETILGGLVVRAQDEVLDGSLRRRLAEMRRLLAGARLPSVAA